MASTDLITPLDLRRPLSVANPADGPKISVSSGTRAASNGKTRCDTTVGPAVQTSDDVDRELVERFQAGDDSAFDEIVAAHQERLARLAHRLLGWSADGDDVLQEVFVAALGHLHKFRRESRLSTWLTAIAIQKCRAHQRRQLLRWRHWRRLAERRTVEINNPSQTESLDDQHAVQSAVRALPRNLREPLVLRYFEELAVPEIAASLGLSVGAVEVRLTRARQRLKETLATRRTRDDARR
jgi:RNA polymerase sigma factor (sigma-70 family)